MTMVRKILLPLDGSVLSETALPWAELLAERTAASLVVLRAAMVRGFPGVDLTDAQVHAVQEAESYVEGVAARLRQRGFTVDLALPYGIAGEAIVDAATRRSADLIVMATHGRSGLGRWIYGSVADAVLRSATVPIFLVRSGAPQPSAAKPLRTIVVPLDGSRVAEAVLPWAEELVRLLRARVVLVRAVETPVFDESTGQRAAVELEASQVEAHSYLHAVAERFTRAGAEVALEVRIGIPPYVIVDCASELEADLIVMATHGRSGVARLVYGSVAAGVLRDAAVPVLLVPARELEAARLAARRPEVARAGEPAALVAQVSLSLSGQQVLSLREAINTALWLGTADPDIVARWRDLLTVLPTAQGLRAQTTPGSGGEPVPPEQPVAV